MKLVLRILFISIFILISGYILFVETERYESNSIVLLKDLSKRQSVKLSDILLGQSSDTYQDSQILELYIRSEEMFFKVDKDYNMTSYYTSEQLDVLQRLYKNTWIPYFRISKENLLEKYNQDLHIVYDEPSGTLMMSFVHANAKKAQKILESIIHYAEETVNAFAKENAQIALRFIQQQKEEKRKAFIESIRKLIEYQNAHHTIDPHIDVERKIDILAELETELIKNSVEYRTKLKSGWNPNGKEMRMLKENIDILKRSISKIRKELAGDNNKKKEELNANVFEFELLKSDMEFAKEVYRQTLINQEEIKIEVAQKSKHFIVVTKPTLADEYTYPNRIWDIFTLLIVMLSLYGIVSAFVTIVVNHKD